MILPYRGVIRIEADDTVEEYPVDLSETLEAFEAEIRAARAVGRTWYKRWCWMLLAFGVAVCGLAWTWGGIWLGYIG